MTIIANHLDRNPWLDYDDEGESPYPLWAWSDGRPVPTTVTVDPIASVGWGGEIYLEFSRADQRIGVFLTEDDLKRIYDAGVVAAKHRRAATEAGWT